MTRASQRLIVSFLVFAAACADDGGSPSDTGSATGEAGDGDGDSGDGDGDSGDGDGDTGDGDGDGDTGDGDGDTGDGDGDTGDGDTGDGDGDTGDGDGDGDGGCGFEPATCDGLLAAFMAEAVAVQSCSGPSECGQVLQGTSCGCTRNWVARTDADTACFYELIDAAGALQCDLGLASSCDCPEADGFDCIEGFCAWNYL